MSGLAGKVIATARGEIGYHEGRCGGHWNNVERYAAGVPGLGWANGQPWCDTFVAWCFWTAGALHLLPGGATASVPTSRDHWKAAKRFSEYPAVGAQVIYGVNGDAHTGIVVSYGAHTITAVEGNTNDNGSAEGDGVYLKTRQRTDAYVYGYGYPDYPEGIDSADPAWQHAGPAPDPAKSRVALARERISRQLRLLDAAIAAGRGDGVKTMRDRIAQALDAGPQS